MMILSIDTCGASGSVALGRVEPNHISILGETELAGKTYSAQLVSAIRALLANHNLAADSLDAIVVANGPGSFTGVRIGVSSAKGFADALRIPLTAVSRLAVLSWKADVERAALDAGRNELYFYHCGQESLIAAADLTSAAGLVVCEAALHWRFPEAVLIAPPNAADALRFAAPRLLARKFDDTATLDGHYLRRSDAELFAKSKSTAGKS